MDRVKLRYMKNWQKLKNNPKLWEKIFVREKIIQSIREFFFIEKFHEVETPLLVPAVIPESYLEIFETYLIDRKNKKHKMFLTASPESSIKKLLAVGIGNCFEITKSFRNNETDSDFHNPEFTILEWYRTNATYENLMDDCEKLLLHISNKLINNNNQNKIVYQNKLIDFSSPWERISIKEAFKKYANIDFNDCITRNKNPFNSEKISVIAKKKGYVIEKNNTWEQVFNQIFLNEVEPHLGISGKPIIIFDYPRPMAALAKIKTDNPIFAERFEFYIGGLELGDGYSELTSLKEQKERFNSEMKLIKNQNKIKIKKDLDFLNALKSGLPKCAGIAVGIDRLVMLFSNSKTIREILPFPLEVS